ncbi:hypothetical protein HKX48_002244 [Thoreauomyces humboldtii]|nr:hypothetical protein HKX48_002244 [Thoreauomyces humboldtii]
MSDAAAPPLPPRSHQADPPLPPRAPLALSPSQTTSAATSRSTSNASLASPTPSTSDLSSDPSRSIVKKPSKSEKLQAAASTVHRKITEKLPDKYKDFKIPTVQEILAYQPVRAVTRQVVPYLTNKDGQLGDDSPAARKRALERVTFVSTWLDAKYKVPFTKFKVGLDPLINAVPVVGDVISTTLSLYVVYLTRRFHVPWQITAKMVWNVLLNSTFGAIPGIGGLFDVAYKPNVRNLLLLQDFLREEALAAGRDPQTIDAAIAKSRAEIDASLPDVVVDATTHHGKHPKHDPETMQKGEAASAGMVAMRF